MSVTGTDDRADRGLDQRQRVIEVAHQRRARLAAGHVPGRAAHVDVDDVGAGALGDARAFRHPARLAAGELHDVEPQALPFGAQRARARPSTSSALAVISETTRPAPEPRDQAPERGVGHARHRREDHPVRQGQGPIGQRPGRNRWSIKALR